MRKNRTYRQSEILCVFLASGALHRVKLAFAIASRCVFSTKEASSIYQRPAFQATQHITEKKSATYATHPYNSSQPYGRKDPQCLIQRLALYSGRHMTWPTRWGC